ncbi:MAG TPA: hypothetical protein VGR62_03090 [Candidatus Binatia bacterium]|jgi:hypothetical protein|nr:hypothetical protein [Candidatus Binatia bacterium]
MSTPRFLVLTGAVGLAASVVLTWPLVLHLDGALLDDGTLDAFQFAWNLWWVPESLLRLGTHPFHTRYLFYPDGVPLLFHTGSFSLGLLALPLELVAGPLVAENVLVIAAPALAVVFGALLAREVTHDAWAGLAGGLVVGMSAMLVWVLPVLYLDCVWAVAALYWAWWRMQRVRRRGALVLALGAMAFLLFASQEYAMVMVAVLALETVVRLVAPRATGLPSPWRAGTAVFWGVTLPLLGALAAIALASPAQPPSPTAIHVTSGYLRGFVTPPWLEAPIAPFYAILYLGSVPLLLVVVAAVRGGRTAVWWIGAMVVTLLMVMGPYLHLDAPIASLPPGATQPVSGLPGPYLLGLDVFPLLRFFRAPYRWLAGTTVLLGVVVAIAVATFRRRAVVVGLLLLLVAGAAVDARGLRAPLVDASVPAAYAVVRDDPQPGAILDLPAGFASGGDGLLSSRYMYYQTSHRRPLLDGTVSRLPRGAAPTITRAITDFATLPFVEYVVVHRDLLRDAKPFSRAHAEHIIDTVLPAQGDVVFDDGTVVVWRLRTFRPETAPPLS